MGIRIAESPATFHVPYGPLNSDGTPEASFVDLKTHPEWVPVIEPCLGWPETRELLQSINSPTSPLMSLAASQGFTSPGQPEFQVVLTSFVTLCYAEVAGKPVGATVAKSRADMTRRFAHDRDAAPGWPREK